MAKTQTIHSSMKSRFGGGFITPAQYIAEIICENQAVRQQKSLSHKFWNNPYWRKTFCYQVQLANSLLKIYSSIVIIKALRHPKTKKLYSLNASHLLDPVLKEEQIKLEAVKQIRPKQPIKFQTKEQPRPPFSKNQSQLDKLRKLD